MNRIEFRAAYRMARLVRGFERDMRIAPASNSLAAAVPASIYGMACRYGDELAGYRSKTFRPMILGPRGVLPA